MVFISSFLVWILSFSKMARSLKLTNHVWKQNIIKYFCDKIFYSFFHARDLWNKVLFTTTTYYFFYYFMNRISLSCNKSGPQRNLGWQRNTNQNCIVNSIEIRTKIYKNVPGTWVLQLPCLVRSSALGIDVDITGQRVLETSESKLVLLLRETISYNLYFSETLSRTTLTSSYHK